MLLESEAKNLVCPWALRAEPLVDWDNVIGSAAVNRPTTSILNCIGHECMAWEMLQNKLKYGRCRLIEKQEI